MPLPRIVAVYHGSHLSETAQEMLKRVKGVIDSLPPKSKVGLEMDWAYASLNLPPRVADLLRARDFFSQLAKHAEEKGHKVVWLETPKRFLEMEHGNLEQLERALERVENADHETPARIEALVHATALYNKIGFAPTATYRSQGMLRTIKRIKQWKSSDVVIGGAVHLQQVAKTLHKPAEHVHPFPDTNEYLRTLDAAVEKEKSKHVAFLRLRRNIH